MNGGVPIYPGGFSCVFKPQLRCKNKTIKIQKGEKGISKLLFKKYAEIEMENIQRFYNATKKYQGRINIFFLQAQKCVPRQKYPNAICAVLMKCAQILQLTT